MSATITRKRIDADLRDIREKPSHRYTAAPVGGDLFDWHFTIRGPPDTEFEGGLYHGRIVLPTEWPMRPPNIIFLTPSGRFEVGTKICLSITSYHQESWQPAWGIRLILEALISFLPTKGEGAIGALDYPAKERKSLARESRHWCCPVCGPIAELLPEAEAGATTPPASPALGGTPGGRGMAAEIAKLRLHAPPPSAPTSPALRPLAPPPEAGEGGGAGSSAPLSPAAAARPASNSSTRAKLSVDDTSSSSGGSAVGAPAAAAPAARPAGDALRQRPVAAAAPLRAAVAPGLRAAEPEEAVAPRRPPCDAFLTAVAYALIVAIALLVARKLTKLNAAGGDSDGGAP